MGLFVVGGVDGGQREDGRDEAWKRGWRTVARGGGGKESMLAMLCSVMKIAGGEGRDVFVAPFGVQFFLRFLRLGKRWKICAGEE